MPTEGHEPLADELKTQADRLEAHGDEVQQHIDETRQEWERNRNDENVPGANPPDTPERDGSPGEDPPPEADFTSRGD
jgi:cytosine/adenosine deaminase-related metal-dependent hydrolase